MMLGFKDWKGWGDKVSVNSPLAMNDEGREMSVVSFQDLPLADRDREWDGD